MGGAAVVLDPATEIVVSRSTDGGVTSEIVSQLNNIDDIDINGLGGVDSFVVSGIFTGTDLDPNTITINGGGDADSVDASGIGSDHRVVFNGNGGDDTFISGAGDDYFEGGAGTDSHQFGGNIANYTVILNADGSATITDNVGDEGVDTSHATVERIVFNDVTLDLTMAVRLFDASDDSLLGTFDTIDDAINAVAGQSVSDLRIDVDGSIYTATESLDISGADINGKNVTIIGDGAVSIGEATGDAVTLNRRFQRRLAGLRERDDRWRPQRHQRQRHSRQSHRVEARRCHRNRQRQSRPVFLRDTGRDRTPDHRRWRLLRQWRL